MKASYLQRIKIDSFGAFSNKVVGPFGPHLNVVFGQNEAGKTTLASFVGGVLFGWEEARGSRNTYKPINAERAGSLFFVEDEGDGSQDERILSRVRNSDGLQGDASLVADIDKETFQTMFSLTSDELRTLRNTTDVTAKLLTAGSGTGASPAHALATVQERLAEYTSRAAGIEHSIANLTAQQSDLRARMAAAAEEAERFKRQDKEFRELEPQRNELLTRLDALNTDIETLAATRANIEKLDREIDSLTDQIASLHDEEDVLVTTYCAHTSGVSELAKLGTSDERALRDQIDSLAVDEAKCEHAVDLAQDNFATSKAAYEALLETADAQAQHERSRRQRGVQVALSIVLPLGFISAGLPLFIHGREITSLSFTAVGVGLIVFAIMLALAAMVMLFRPNKEEDAKEARKQDAQWVMLQDKKKLEACLESQEAFKVRARAQLDAAGLADANGSLRRSRTLLDEAKDARAENNLFQQRLQALISRRSALEESLASAKRQRRRLYERIDLRSERTIEAVDDALAQKSQQRMGLLETSEGLNRRYGELKQELSHAEHLHDFDELKLLYQQVRTRQDESAQEYARLLLARRMLESAIATWESKSQPEVYRQASRLLSLMTDGRWTKVSLTAEGRLQVTDAVKTTRDPVQLSLGTCQQLYLSLRIALLMTADNVGRAVPILADDILVNFDSTRRAGAARALAELARMRQVVLFTCHEEIVETMREADPTLNEVEL
ncbi:ATP-binding protein [Eggerthella sinensis]|uniref:Sugar ABC transporter ATP-binding protein n=1 Tax=Eggerthella sinensis TaxID=242230 RepID=A0A3N0J229_9ACTN|nr:AAA family ATPase [Eggerthella sinensis]RDB71114.1 sugar ABC transporter ATP-binding protein [Eggerthella sinensis]RNM43279.1 sugar ABC transporter ATP-binding protein [Eggerthella sinensis]